MMNVNERTVVSSSTVSDLVRSRLWYKKLFNFISVAVMPSFIVYHGTIQPDNRQYVTTRIHILHWCQIEFYVLPYGEGNAYKYNIIVSK